MCAYRSAYAFAWQVYMRAHWVFPLSLMEEPKQSAYSMRQNRAQQLNYLHPNRSYVVFLWYVLFCDTFLACFCFVTFFVVSFRFWHVALFSCPDFFVFVYVNVCLVRTLMACDISVKPIHQSTRHSVNVWKPARLVCWQTEHAHGEPWLLLSLTAGLNPYAQNKQPRDAGGCQRLPWRTNTHALISFPLALFSFFCSNLPQKYKLELTEELWRGLIPGDGMCLEVNRNVWRMSLASVMTSRRHARSVVRHWSCMSVCFMSVFEVSVLYKSSQVRSSLVLPSWIKGHW